MSIDCSIQRAARTSSANINSMVAFIQKVLGTLRQSTRAERFQLGSRKQVIKSQGNKKTDGRATSYGLGPVSFKSNIGQSQIWISCPGRNGSQSGERLVFNHALIPSERLRDGAARDPALIAGALPRHQAVKQEKRLGPIRQAAA